MVFHQRVLYLTLPLLLLCCVCRSDDAQKASRDESAGARGKAKSTTPFVRVRELDDGEPAALETAIVRFASPTGKEPSIVVDLIGVVHIGDQTYYEKLNAIFPQYDALLYELVAPENARVPRAGDKRRSGSMLSGVQRMMKSMLDLEFQLDHIDYTEKNFVHADMSPKEFAKTMSDRNESFLKMFFKAMGHGAAMQAKDPERFNDAAMLMALFARDRALRLKRLMARQFEDLETMTVMFNGPDGSTIITERNKKAFKVMDREITAGKKRLGVFYGAGHLPDMEQRLINDYGLELKEVRWLSAWSLQPKEKSKD